MEYRENVVLSGNYLLCTELTEFHMALWITGFGIKTKSGETILPLEHRFHLDHYEEELNYLKVKFRIYHTGLESYKAKIFPDDRQFQFEGNFYPLENFTIFFDELEEKKLTSRIPHEN